MYLENVVFDATDPRELGGRWESVLGTETLTDEPDGFETRLAVPDGPTLDLCFQRVPDPPTGAERLRLDVRDVEDGHEGASSLTALVLEVADPVRDRDFWAWLTGWAPSSVDRARLEHPSGRGPVLELVPERDPKVAGKNPVHLDVRLEAGDDADAIVEGIAGRGGRETHPGWGDLPWRTFVDPSGNEFCVLPSRG